MTGEKPLADAINTAEAFIELVDINDAEALRKILHPDMMQFAKIGDKLMPFKGPDFINMVAEKKIGGKSREMSIKNVQLVRAGSADVIVQAVSEEYDFIYQISMVEEGGKWIIVTVLADIKPIQ